MIRSLAVSRIQLYLGFRGDKSAEIITAIQDAQQELEQGTFLPWFLLSDPLSLSTVANDEKIALTSVTGFLREDEESSLFYYNSTADADERWVELDKLSLRELREAFQDETGAPEAYALDDTYLRIGPIPDAVYSLRMSYYKAETVLSTDVENQWLKYAHQLMIGKAGQKIALALRDKEAFDYFTSQEAMGLADVVRNHTARD